MKAKFFSMKVIIITIAAILAFGTIVPSVSAEGVPEWVKSNAGWWANGDIGESDFVSGIQFLIEDGVISVPPTDISSTEKSSTIPEWVKSNAGWWANGDIGESDFVSGIQFLIQAGIISVSLNETGNMESQSKSVDSKLASLQAELDKCAEITRAYDRLNCERDAEHKIAVYHYKENSKTFEIGPVTFYWSGLETDGNSLEITSSGQALLNLRILVENTGSNQNESLFCTGPAVCNYDITNGDNVYKYSQMDFTNGQVILKPGEPEIFNMMFGPNIGGGGTTFEYDSGKDYIFRINEQFGSGSIPLNLE